MWQLFLMLNYWVTVYHYFILVLIAFNIQEQIRFKKVKFGLCAHKDVNEVVSRLAFNQVR